MENITVKSSDPECSVCGDCSEEKVRLNKKALYLSYFTVFYNILEGLVSIVVGLSAGSAALLGFGLDSFVESISGGIMTWRFFKADNSHEEDERKEAIAIKLVAVSFIIFGIYVLYESLEKIVLFKIPQPTFLGILIAIVSLIVMPVLYYLKKETGRSVGSMSLVADSRQTLTCVLLSIALLAGLGINYLFGIWWADPGMGIVISGFLFKEGRDAWINKDICC